MGWPYYIIELERYLIPILLSPGAADFEPAEVWQVDFPGPFPEDATRIRLQVDYSGDAARAYRAIP